MAIRKYIGKVPIHVYDDSASDLRSLIRMMGGVYAFLRGKISYHELWYRLLIYKHYKEFFVGNNVYFRARVGKGEGQSDTVPPDVVFRRLKCNEHVLLKMDVEGSEYSILRDFLAYEEAIDLVVVEFHDTFRYRREFEATVEEFREWYNIVHVHANNFSALATDGLPLVVEITFMSKRFEVDSLFQRDLPIPGLDFPNDPTQPDIAIHFA